MTIKKVYCLFEQSGTFKKQFRELGVDAYDYDIENEFGETDVQCDLFNEIENAYCGKQSLFDEVSQDDLVMAFFPCVRFEDQILLWFRGENYAQKKWDLERKIEYDLDIHADLHLFYSLVLKLTVIAIRGGVEIDNRKSVLALALSAALQPVEAVRNRPRPTHQRRLFQEADNVLLHQL